MKSLVLRNNWARRLVLFVAICIAALSARPYAGGWNDGSRLATVESLVDRGTLAIDHSIFVEVPALTPDRASPYPRDFELLQKFGTKDKLYINGHFYSDKSPAPAFAMAGIYQIWRWLGDPSAQESPDQFCRLMTCATSSLSFIIGVCCLFGIGFRIGLSPVRNLAFTLVFAVGSVAAPYAQYVNNHIMLFAVAALMFLSLLNGLAKGWQTRRLVWIGVLAGMGYTIDLAAGPLLCLCVGGYLLWSERIRFRLAWVVMAALPMVAFHHVVNYQIGGTFGPANAVAAYFEWPGSPFGPQNMTGGWRHASWDKGVLYALDMLFGKKGFLGYNMVLFLPLLCLPALMRQRTPERALLIASFCWAGATWLLYAATSNNLSGGCCSVRWFVPLLVPGFFGVCLVIREWPETSNDAMILGAGSIVFGIEMISRGPWLEPHLTIFWIDYATTLIAWLAMHIVRERRRRRGATAVAQLAAQPAIRVAA